MDSVAIVFPGCASLEIAQACARLRARGSLRYASRDGGAVTTLDGPRIAADLAWAELAAEELRVLLLPGGELDAVARDDGLSALLARAHSAGAVVGGICNGALLLARAGLLRGRRATHTATDALAPRPHWAALRDWADPLLEGSRYVDWPVVVDGGVVTAKPWAAIDFAAAVEVAAGLSGPAEAARASAYSRGQPEGEGSEPSFLVELRAGGQPLSTSLVMEHVAWLRSLEVQGRLVLAGPCPGEEAGLVVLRARDLESAKGIAAEDPFVRAGARRATVRSWQISNEANSHLGLPLGPLPR